MRTLRQGTVMGLVCLVLAATLSPASAATLSCTKGTAVKTVKGKSTMLYKGKRVSCTKTASVTPTGPTVSAKPEIRFASNTMNDLVIRPNLTITIRNTDAVAHTLIIASEGVSVSTPANDISAFISPSKPGTYQMTTLENPNIKATLTVVP